MKYQATRFSAALALWAFFIPPVMAEEKAGDRALVVIDLRPAEEREGSGLTPLTGICNQDVYRVADVASNPLKLTALKSDLAEQLGSAGEGKTLTVMNWTVYYNKQLEGGQPWAKIVGVGGIPIPGKNQGKFPGSKCSRQESAGGWFSAVRSPGKIHRWCPSLKVLMPARPWACELFIHPGVNSKGSSRAVPPTPRRFSTACTRRPKR